MFACALEMQYKATNGILQPQANSPQREHQRVVKQLMHFAMRTSPPDFFGLKESGEDGPGSGCRWPRASGLPCTRLAKWLRRRHAGRLPALTARSWAAAERGEGEFLIKIPQETALEREKGEKKKINKQKKKLQNS